MPSRTFAGSLGLTGDWDLHEAGWKDGMDGNLLWLSVLTQGRVKEQVALEPGAPAEGDVYLLSGTHATHPNELAVYDEAAWHYKTPLAGWRLYNIALGSFVRFDGAGWGLDDPAAAPAGSVPDGVVSGCDVVYAGTGLNFAMTAGTFYLNGSLYSADAQTLALDAADPALDRIDTLYVAGDGTFGKITGTPDAAPEAPDVDPETQLFLMAVSVPAGAVDLTALIQSVTIYDEGAAGEWPVTLVGAHINAASAVDPYQGAESIEATAAVSGDTIRFLAAAPIQFGSSGNLLFRLKSKGAWVTSQLILSWYSAGRRVGTFTSRVHLRDRTFGFDSSNTADHQLVSIPKSRFYLSPNVMVDELRVQVISAGGIGFFLDDVVLQTPDDGTTINIITNGLTQDQADKLYQPKITVETVPGAYTFVAADAGKHKRFTNGADVLAVVPPDTFTPGDRVRITAAGAGNVTLDDDGGAVVLNSRDGALVSAGQFAVFEIECVADNEFDVLGDVTV